MASSLYIILMIQALLKGEPAGKVFKDGLRYAAALLAALGLYYAVTLVICRLSGTELLSYGYSGNSILFRVLLTYSSFLRTLFSGYFGYVNGTLSVLAHVVCIAAGAWLVIRYFIVQKRVPELALAAVCAVLLPLVDMEGSGEETGHVIAPMEKTEKTLPLYPRKNGMPAKRPLKADKS